MSNIKKLMASAAGGGGLVIEDVFTTLSWQGNGTNGHQIDFKGVDIDGEDGVIFVRRHDGGNHYVYPTVTRSISSNGNPQWLYTDATAYGDDQTHLVINSTGMELSSAYFTNQNGTRHTASVFRNAPRFFDSFIYTGTGGTGTRAISHNLGCEIGMIAIHPIGVNSSWLWYHRGNGGTLNTTDGPWYHYGTITQPYQNVVGFFGDGSTFTPFTDTEFYINAGNVSFNNAGTQYLCMVWAHDPLGPSGDGSDGLVSCDYWDTYYSQPRTTANVGWEPQFMWINQTNSSYHIRDFNDVRGWQIKAMVSDNAVANNWSQSRSVYDDFTFSPHARGLFNTGSAGEHQQGDKWITMLVRKHGMKEPSSGTEVYDRVYNGENTAGVAPGFAFDFKPDLIIRDYNFSSASYPQWFVRNNWSGGENYGLRSSDDGATLGNYSYDMGWANPYYGMNANSGTNTDLFGFAFKKTRGFFDQVSWLSDGTTYGNIPHNLGVKPELLIVKAINQSTPWVAWSKYMNPSNGTSGSDSTTGKLGLTSNSPYDGYDAYFGSTVNHTDTTFQVGYDNATVRFDYMYNAYMWATLPGISKVGAYIGNGSTLNIDCGFSSGARFVMIKNCTNSGNWNIYDVEAGIVAGNDTWNDWNLTVGKKNYLDIIDTYNQGFAVNKDAGAPEVDDTNLTNNHYLFLAIA